MARRRRYETVHCTVPSEVLVLLYGIATLSHMYLFVLHFYTKYSAVHVLVLYSSYEVSYSTVPAYEGVDYKIRTGSYRVQV